MYKVYPEGFDFTSYEQKYKDAFTVRITKSGNNNKNDQKLIDLHDEFTKIQNWSEINKIKYLVKNFPSTLEDLLVLQPIEICEIYLAFKQLNQNEQNKINSINFNYDIFKSRIYSFFIKYFSKLNVNTCFYCDINFINFYTKQIPVKQKIKTITKKQFDLDHFIPKQHCKLFALCLYNFVPCCSNCNSGSKGSSFTYNCTKASELASVFPTSKTYDWINNMKFKILPKKYDAIADLLYSENYKDFGIELESSNKLYEEESNTFEILPKYDFFTKQFVNQIDKYRMYDKNFFYLFAQKLPIGTASFLYEAIFNNELRDYNQLPFKKIYKDIKDIFEN